MKQEFILTEPGTMEYNGEIVATINTTNIVTTK